MEEDDGSRIYFCRWKNRFWLPCNYDKSEGSATSQRLAPIAKAVPDMDHPSSGCLDGSSGEGEGVMAGWDMFEPWDQEAEQTKEDALLDDDMPLEALIQPPKPEPMEPNVLPTPVAPSPAEQELHNATHVRSAPWSKFCVQGKG